VVPRQVGMAPAHPFDAAVHDPRQLADVLLGSLTPDRELVAVDPHPHLDPGRLRSLCGHRNPSGEDHFTPARELPAPPGGRSGPPRPRGPVPLRRVLSGAQPLIVTPSSAASAFSMRATASFTSSSFKVRSSARYVME